MIFKYKLIGLIIILLFFTSMIPANAVVGTDTIISDSINDALINDLSGPSLKNTTDDETSPVTKHFLEVCPGTSILLINKFYGDIKNRISIFKNSNIDPLDFYNCYLSDDSKLFATTPPGGDTEYFNARALAKNVPAYQSFIDNVERNLKDLSKMSKKEQIDEINFEYPMAATIEKHLKEWEPNKINYVMEHSQLDTEDIAAKSPKTSDIVEKHWEEYNDYVDTQLRIYDRDIMNWATCWDLYDHNTDLTNPGRVNIDSFTRTINNINDTLNILDKRRYTSSSANLGTFSSGLLAGGTGVAILGGNGYKWVKSKVISDSASIAEAEPAPAPMKGLVRDGVVRFPKTVEGLPIVESAADKGVVLSDINYVDPMEPQDPSIEFIESARIIGEYSENTPIPDWLEANRNNPGATAKIAGFLKTEHTLRIVHGRISITAGVEGRETGYTITSGESVIECYFTGPHGENSLVSGWTRVYGHHSSGYSSGIRPISPGSGSGSSPGSGGSPVVPVIPEAGSGGGSPTPVVPEAGSGSGSPTPVVPESGSGSGSPTPVVPEAGSGSGSGSVSTSSITVKDMIQKISGDSSSLKINENVTVTCSNETNDFLLTDKVLNSEESLNHLGLNYDSPIIKESIQEFTGTPIAYNENPYADFTQKNIPSYATIVTAVGGVILGLGLGGFLVAKISIFASWIGILVGCILLAIGTILISIALSLASIANTISMMINNLYTTMGMLIRINNYYIAP